MTVKMIYMEQIENLRQKIFETIVKNVSNRNKKEHRAPIKFPFTFLYHKNLI